MLYLIVKVIIWWYLYLILKTNMYFDRKRFPEKFNFLCEDKKKALFNIVSFEYGPEILLKIKINTSALHQKNINY